MRLWSLSDAECPRCRRESVLFGLKSEPTGWKVFCECSRSERCGHEWTPGRVSRADVADMDEAFERAESMCRAFRV